LTENGCLQIILIAEFIAESNTDRARASIRALIGSVRTVAVVRTEGAERRVPITTLKVDDVVLVKAGEKIPVDGTVVAGNGSVERSRDFWREHAD
jgi:Cd2+/Zn2+-exporting ATPase